MIRQIETKFFNFDQNNSGGYFVENEKLGVGPEIIIEAQNYNEAWNKLEALGEQCSGFWNYCDCCGERWYKGWKEEGHDVPSIYNTPIENFKATDFREYVYVHYYDGTFKRFDFKKAE